MRLFTDLQPINIEELLVTTISNALGILLSGPQDAREQLLNYLSAREALRLLSRIGMPTRMSGDGFVVSQNPEAGSPLMRGDACNLRLGRRISLVAGGSPP